MGEGLTNREGVTIGLTLSSSLWIREIEDNARGLSNNNINKKI